MAERLNQPTRRAPASPGPDRASTRAKVASIYFIALAVLAATVALVTYTFATPRPKIQAIGQIEDFPVSPEPYRVVEEVTLFVVNTGEELFVLDARYRAPGGYLVSWNSIERIFIDPSTGAHFDLSGQPLRIATRSLDKYPAYIEDGWVYVELYDW